MGYWLNFIGFYYQDDETHKYVRINQSEINNVLKKEGIEAVTYAKTRFDPKTDILEILIDANDLYLYMIEVEVEVLKTGTGVTVRLNKNIKIQKYVKPHIFHHFNCEFTKNYIICQAASFTWDNMTNVNMMGWKRYKTDTLKTMDMQKVSIIEKEGVFPYKLKYLLRVNPLMSIAVEDYEEDAVSYLRCQPNKSYAKIESISLTEKMRINVDIPPSVFKPYDLSFAMRYNPWVEMKSRALLVKNDDWIEFEEPAKKDNTKLKKIIFSIVFVMLIMTMLILLFVIFKIIRKK